MWPDLRRLRSQGNHTDRAVYGYCLLHSCGCHYQCSHVAAPCKKSASSRHPALHGWLVGHFLDGFVTWLKNPVSLYSRGDRTAFDDLLAISMGTRELQVGGNVHHVRDLHGRPSSADGRHVPCFRQLLARLGTNGTTTQIGTVFAHQACAREFLR